MGKRHHFVPQFYLARFATGEEIWTYDMQDSTTRGTPVANTAFEKYLYSVTLEDGKRIHDLEDRIAGIESSAAPVFDKVMRAAKLTDDERTDFASFIAIMHVRTDAFRHQYAQTAMSALQIQMYATARHDEAFKTHIEGYQRETGRRMSPEEIDKLRESMLNPQEFTIAVDKEWTLQALAYHEHLTPIFCAMHWTVMVARAPRYFITSDNPVAFEVPPAHRHPFYGGGLVDPHVELTFPLSPETCLLATWNKGRPARCEIGSEVVKSLNRTRAIYARRFLFGPVRDGGISLLGEKYKDAGPRLKISGFGPDEYSAVELRRGRRKAGA